MRWIFFSPIVVILFGGICFYAGFKLFGFIRYFYPNIKITVFWILFAVLCCLLLLLIVFRPRFIFLRQLSSLWVTIFLYIFMLFALLVAVDLVKLFLHFAGKLPEKFNVYSVGSALVLCFGLIVYGASNARLLETVNYRINIQDTGINKEINNKRIVLISDTHIGASIGKKHIKRIVDEINRAEPDIVCIAGDIFDGNIDQSSDLQGVINELKKINSPLGVYACLGNHDVHRRSTDRIVKTLNEAGITVLQDDVHKLMDGFYIIGRKEQYPIGIESVRKPAAELTSGLDSGSFIVMMDHRPGQFAQIEKLGVNLLLNGHTHKGQIFPGTIITRLIFKRAGAIAYGHWQGELMHAIVTSGAGFWGPSIRIGTQSEVVVIDINIVQ
ncbi:MAG: metallophosphoesterase [Treponema sp.]|jgi:predicted MPP superfamily phosphohydrolase|nr:metallophosphoesterase [Treponema sp.]